MLLWRSIFASLVLLASTAAVTAQTSAPASSQVNLIHRSAAASATQASDPVTGAGSGRVIGSLLAVLAVIALLYWASRRWLPAAGRTGRAVQVLSRTAISGKQAILLIQVGRRVLVVGHGGQQLNTLCTIDDPEEAAALIEQLRADRATPAIVTRRSEPAAQENSGDLDRISSTQQEVDRLLGRIRGMARTMDRT